MDWKYHMLLTKGGDILTVSTKLRDLSITSPLNKYRALYLPFRNTYGHQNWQSGNLRWGSPTFKVTWSFVYVVTWLKEKTYICTSAISMTTKLGRVLTWGWGTQSSKLVNFWLCGHMTKEKNLISALMQYLWPSNLAGC